MGRSFEANMKVVIAAIEAKDGALAQCASSSTCQAVKKVGASAGETVSSLWNSFTTGIKTTAFRTHLQLDIFGLNVKVKTLKKEFGVQAFSLIKNMKSTWTSDTTLEKIFQGIRK